jgi:hypothetical protein
MGAEARVKRDGRLPWQEIDGRAVVVVPGRRELHEMDETATFLWNALASPRSEAELVEALCEAYDVEAQAAARDVRAYVAELQAKGLLAVA